LVEATIPNSTETSHREWEGILDSAGYQFALFDGLNRFYARDEEPELASLLSVPANVLDDFVPLHWSHEVAEAADRVGRLEIEVTGAARRIDELSAEHDRAWATARVAQDTAMIAGEQVDVLRADLAAAQLRTARALEAARVSDHELEALRATRLFRKTARLRDAYSGVRRALRL
jgi:hypothetical protein